MAYDEALAERVRAALGSEPGVTERRMFGSLAFLVEGNLATSVRAADLLVRVGPDWVAEAQARGARPAQMGKRTMKGWVEVAPGDDLDEWVARGVAFARAVAAQKP
jgi:TfoX/Sxy family transcriptional regulator of competence genes